MFSRSQSALWLLTFAILLGHSAEQAVAAEVTPAAPAAARLIARHCLECHGTSEKKGGLDLTHRDGALAGGESGPAIVPGKPEESLLWELVDGGDMPKDRPPLTDEEKEALRAWLAAGAPYDRPIDPLAFSSDRRAGYDWWSLQPVKKAAPPAVKNVAWVRGEIDRFVLARLEAAGLSPAPEADRRTLIRRLYFDLVGLPPEPEAVERFLEDDSPDAYERCVDELLKSRHYGERWARHWLDIVRFGESQGFERNLIRDNAWRYRDWVIQAFNDDLPYDEFVRRQIAGDVLYPGDLGALLATGYHVAGTWDQVGHIEGSADMQKAARQDHLEDLVATLGQAYLGLTINCARCHDHKFDPISQREYYQVTALLGGVTQEEKERQGIDARPRGGEEQRYAELERELARFEQEMRGRHGDDGSPMPALEALYTRFEPGHTLTDEAKPGGSLDLAAGKTPRWASSEPAASLVAAVQKGGELTVETWITPASTDQKGPARIVTLSLDTGQRNFTLGQEGDRFDFRLRTTKTSTNGIASLASPPRSVTAKRTHVACTFDKSGASRIYVDGRQVAEFRPGGDFSNWDARQRFALGNELTGDRPWEGEFHFVAVYARALTADEIGEHYRNESKGVRAGRPWSDVAAAMTAEESTRHEQLLAQLRDIAAARGPAADFSGVAHVIIPRQPPIYHVLSRGDYRKPQDVVAPAGLKALSGLSGDFGLSPDAPEEERRRALAQWLTDPQNPLTARVLVNRLWYYHFGAGIAHSPSDFGFNGGVPSHPELLDWLAAAFMDGNWKIKDMHRRIVTSSAYRQASTVSNPRGEEIDADNRLLWRQNRRRLEGEIIRDAALAVSGALNPQIGGPSYRDVNVKLDRNHEFSDPTGEFSETVNRRTIYRLWARSGNEPMLEALDCPDPSVMSPRRPVTITPVQALALLNNPLTENCAARLAERVRSEAGEDTSAQLRRAFHLALGRPPDAKELADCLAFTSEHGLEQLCLVLLNTNEFLFVE